MLDGWVHHTVVHKSDPTQTVFMTYELKMVFVFLKVIQTIKGQYFMTHDNYM